jgi:competence protein ComEA
MLKNIFTRWSGIPLKEKVTVIGLVLGWGVFLGGLIGLLWWSNSQARIEVQAQVSSGGDARSGKMFIEVAGAVKAPGVYVLEAGSRVADALQAAGYFSEKSDYLYIVKNLNQARELKDGEKLYVPFYGEQTAAEIHNETGGISINTASKEVLEELPGIGSKRAEDIISGRPYASIDELLTKKIVTESMFKELQNSINL